MPSEPSIKIVISCHKEIDFPKSDIYLPVHLGAVNAPNPLPGMQPDNEGDNISDRNFTYCELTAQYWAWKHLDADYVGQCHYRRYFYFGDAKHKANDHLQIEAPSLSPLAIDKFELEDAELIRRIVSAHDLIVAPQWNVAGAPTPCGNKQTVREHMVSYGLMLDEDVNKLVDITRRLSPEYADELVSYLNGGKYRGYNCFIMRKELFHRLCEFEFPILQEFDASFDYSSMRTTRKRICGYFAEILYSVFINHLIHEGGCDIEERPLIFFDDTSRLYSLGAAGNDANKPDLHIVWRYEDPCEGRLVPAVDTLVDHLSPDHTYALTVVHDKFFNFNELKRLLQNKPDNLVIDDAVYPVFDCIPVSAGLGKEEMRALLPFLMVASDVSGASTAGKVLWIDGIAVFDGDPFELAAHVPESGIAGMSGLFLQRELNKPQCMELSDAFYGQLSGRKDCCDPSVLLFDTGKMAPFDRRSVIDLFRQGVDAMGIDFERLMRARRKDFLDVKDYFGNDRDQFTLPPEYFMSLGLLLEKLGAHLLPLKVACPAMDDVEAKTWCNEDDAKVFSSIGSAVLIHYVNEVEPLNCLQGRFSRFYWSAARKSDVYEMLMVLATEKRPHRARLKNRLLPPLSRRRRFLGKIRRLL